MALAQMGSEAKLSAELVATLVSDMEDGGPGAGGAGKPRCWAQGWLRLLLVNETVKHMKDIEWLILVSKWVMMVNDG